MSDGHGGTAVGTVSVTVKQETSGQNFSKIKREGDSFRLFFHGIPGRTYTIQYTPSLDTPDWQTLGSSTANAQGAYEYLDTPPPGTTSRYYRSVYP